MAGKKIYGEEKKQISLSLTKTAVKWLETKKVELTARSLSDVIERMAREQNETSDPPPGDEQNQTLVLNQKDSEALVKALLDPCSHNESLRTVRAMYEQVISA
jgi:hypothetical protein